MSTSREAEQAAWLADNRQRWSERAGDWNRMLNEHPEQRERELAHTAAALDLQPGQRLLDAGCGAGQWAIGFAQRGCVVTAMDLAPGMVAQASANARDAGVEIAFREGNIAALPDADASFDRVHCRCVLQFSPTPVVALGEFARVLAPGGRLFVAVPGPFSRMYAGSYERFLDRDRRNTNLLPWELEGLLGELGWTVRDGWPQFIPAEEAPPIAPEAAATLPRPLQQAAAFYWCCVAERADGTA